MKMSFCPERGEGVDKTHDRTKGCSVRYLTIYLVCV